MTENKERLYSPKRIRRVMTRAGIDFNKSLGQNFLIDGNIVRKIVDAAGVTKEDTVLEIGPGVGTMTEELLLRAKKVISVEVDDRLIPVLEEELSEFPNFRLVHADAMKADFRELLEREAPGERVKVVANLPYYITTPLLQRFLSEGLPVESCTVMIQREVADRLTAEPSTPEYGSLTLFAAVYSDVSRAVLAPKEVFLPQPKVDSAVVHLKCHPAPEGVDAKRLTDMIQAAFQQRRKTVLNSMARAAGVEKGEMRRVFERVGIDPRARAENLSLEDFVSVLRCLTNDKEG